MNDVKTAEEAYDKTKSIIGKERLASSTTHLRHFNNWIKSYLIDKYCPPSNAFVLDLASGKGGDIPKWKHRNPEHIVFADISKQSLIECYKKYITHNIAETVRGTFIYGDTFRCNMKALMPDLKFHIASCQFALHYSFEDYEMASQAIANLSDQLHEGGCVIITTVDAFKLVEKFRQQAALGGTQEEMRTIKNSAFEAKRFFELDQPIPAFGAGYKFFLTESVGNVQEYLIHPTVLDDLFDIHNMKRVEGECFHEFYRKVISDDSYHKAKQLFYDTLMRLEGRTQNAAMTPDEWEVVGLYSFYVYEKQGERVPPVKADRKPMPVSWKMNLIDASNGTTEIVDVPHDDDRRYSKSRSRQYK